jgi:monothiol glutaredoxin
MDYRPRKGANIKGSLIFVMIYLSLTSRQAVKAHPVVLFMKGDPGAPRCGFSRAVSQVVAAYEVPNDKFKTYDVLADQELRESIKEFSYVTLGNYTFHNLLRYRDWPTIPQLYVNGEFVGGCDIVLDSE